jgi:hypothetical protein
MSKISYEVVEHDGGSAYKAEGAFSEAFPTHGAACRAAERAAREQGVPGDTTSISYEDERGRWHQKCPWATTDPRRAPSVEDTVASEVRAGGTRARFAFGLSVRRLAEPLSRAR